MFIVRRRARTTPTEHTTIALVSPRELNKENSNVGNQADSVSYEMFTLCGAPQQHVLIPDHIRLRSALMSDSHPERQPQAGLGSQLSKVQQLAFSA
jgi:hypothetical protein